MLLCFAADQINDSVCIPNLFLKALRLEVNHSVCAEVAHKGDIIRGCGRDDLISHGAAGNVGVYAVQLARRAGVRTVVIQL